MEPLAIVLEWQRTGLLAAEVAEKFSVCSLYGKCEPCTMKINGGNVLDKEISFPSCINESINGNSGSKGFKCCGGIMASEAISLLRDFYEQGNSNGMNGNQPF
ncbi:hypothetical protein EUGRSUZ_E02147 [Eucalyptus grandis]|uniref:Uncharacterized protein n=2 Tax=Eucalyptus grandis TaxID=71139 RepID=A0ACC3KXE0_EUCGR|nr:hypothetical protein EUGRSUZ_E02147 [Eucalyptus grandis]